MIIRNIDEVEVASYEKGVKKRVVIGPREGTPTFVMRVFELDPGMSTPYHTHDWEHEILVLSGEGVVVDENGKEIRVKSLDSVYLPPEEKHCLKNNGNGVFRLVCLVPLRGETP